MMPYFTTQLFKKSPGMVGLYISGAYSATMSTISTGLNSCATVLFKVHITYNLDYKTDGHFLSGTKKSTLGFNKVRKTV